MCLRSGTTSITPRAAALFLSFPPADPPSTAELDKALIDIPEETRHEFASRLFDHGYVGFDPKYHEATWVYAVRKD